MPRTKVKRRTEARRTERQRRGSLADLAVEAVTLERNQQTLWNLDVFGKPLPCTVWRLDEELSECVEELWAAGDGLAQAECTLDALHHFAPLLRGRIPGAWKKLKTWRRHDMPPPIPPTVVRGIAGLAWVQGAWTSRLAS